MSAAVHDQPLVLEGSVIVTVQVPDVPEWKEPAVAPPTVVVLEQPLAVNFVPADMIALVKLALPVGPTVMRVLPPV